MVSVVVEGGGVRVSVLLFKMTVLILFLLVLLMMLVRGLWQGNGC